MPRGRNLQLQALNRPVERQETPPQVEEDYDDDDRQESPAIEPQQGSSSKRPLTRYSVPQQSVTWRDAYKDTKNLQLLPRYDPEVPLSQFLREIESVAAGALWPDSFYPAALASACARHHEASTIAKDLFRQKLSWEETKLAFTAGVSAHNLFIRPERTVAVHMPKAGESYVKDIEQFQVLSDVCLSSNPARIFAEMYITKLDPETQAYISHYLLTLRGENHNREIDVPYIKAILKERDLVHGKVFRIPEGSKETKQSNGIYCTQCLETHPFGEHTSKNSSTKRSTPETSNEEPNTERKSREENDQQPKPLSRQEESRASNGASSVLHCSHCNRNGHVWETCYSNPRNKHEPKPDWYFTKNDNKGGTPNATSSQGAARSSSRA